MKMKKKFLWMMAVVVACSFTLTALASCGDDEEDSSVSVKNGEACIVAVLPSNLSPYASLEVTYYDAQGEARNFSVKNGETSDVMPDYAKSALTLTQLMSSFTLDVSKCIVRTVKFAVPAGKKISCKYKVVVTSDEVTTYPDKAFSPFAIVTGKRSNGEALVPQGTSTFSQITFSGVEQFKSWLERLAGREHESYIEME